MRAPGRIGDIAPDPSHSNFFQPVSDSPEAEPPQSEDDHGDVSCDDDNNHSLEIEIVRDAHFDPSIFLTPLCFVGNNDGSIAALLQDVCRRVSPNDPLQTAKWLFFLLVIHGSIYDVETAALLLRLHSRKIKELEEKCASHAGMNYR